ncbi:regulator of chromosome condensation family protein [Striga asiatica]|uniref:Regulator of chromosome condensation family protein n=1 Tax=Striga asiatica TaxID=4170 RepID=A0A5A7QSD3_STRAF|nr:regulator of chromosome condensation family protein [Striga asiatica]
MADLGSYGNADRDIEQYLLTLSERAWNMKEMLVRSVYIALNFVRGEKDKKDETSLIWISSSGERSLKLASVSRIIPGQRTAVFQRYLRPEKEYLSFSLIYNDGKRSLDLICKDKVEAEIWIAGLKALTSSGQAGRSKIDGWSDGAFYFDDNSNLTSSSPSSSSASATRGLSSPDLSTHLDRSHVASSDPSTSMQAKAASNTTNDTLRVSVSSAPSTSSHGSAPDDCDALGDVYIWGEVICDLIVKSGPDRTSVSTRADILSPRPLESNIVLDVHYISCGVRHAALVTRTGEVFTWGEESGGRLGHGLGRDAAHPRPSAASPREVESLTGLRTVAVACGVWHTAAVVEVIATQPSAGKLFTWGDGDKNRLGHGDREARVKPTCVPALIDHNFHKVACGHSLTLGLTTSGRVFAMGSTVYGQLGNPQSDGKLPCLVGDRLAGECVEEISCGAYHVAVLTSKNEVYTWGKGANGRLGHGDLEDRKSPMLVEGLKDRHVKSIACGSNYTSAICVHKWVSGAEQSQCSACRQAFGFTRKRHNCYNCGLVHCHACSSRKAVRAALAPDPGKPHRVCDPCYAKLAKVAEGVVAHSRRNSSGPRLSGENKDRLDKADLRLAQKSGVATSNFELMKQLDSKAGRQGKKGDTFSLARSSQVSLLQLGREAVLSAAVRNVVPKPIVAPSSVSSRSVSPFSRKPSPPRSATPVPTTSGLSFAKSISDSLRKTNEVLNQEVHKLRVQVENLKSRCELQELELQQSAKKTQEAMAVAAEESAKCKAAKEVIKSLTAQLKDMAERLPPGAYDPDSLKLIYLPNGSEPKGTTHNTGENGETNSRTDAPNNSYSGTDSSMLDRARGPSELLGDDSLISKGGGGRHGQAHRDSMSENIESKESMSYRDSDASSRSRNTVVPSIEAGWIEQYEPGVYITLVALSDGTRDLKRVRFSRRRFGEHQAETWWSENRERVYEKYNVRGSDKSSVSGQAARRSEGAFSPSSQV